jgi:hypothetical protein
MERRLFLTNRDVNINNEPNNKMKTYRSIRNLCVCLAFTAIAFGTPLTAAEVKTAKGGASDLMSKPLRTEADVTALKAGDTVAMACPKCKTIAVTRVTKEWKGNVTTATVGQKHLCPSCENAFEVTGHGKAAKEHVVHKCKNCGSTDAFCCAVQPAGSPTKGMEEKR